jgi:hypothetical protein
MSERDWKRLGAKTALALLYVPRYYAFLTQPNGRGEQPPPQWQVPEPESVNVPPAIGMNLKS